MPTPEIRVLSEADAAEFWAVRLRGLREDPESFGSAYEESVDTPIEEVARRLKGPADSFVFGAFAPHLVGTVGCHRKEGMKLRHKATIWGMYVTPEWRGRALGRALLTAAIEPRGRWRSGATVAPGGDRQRSRLRVVSVAGVYGLRY